MNSGRATLDDVAELVGCHSQTIGRVLRGQQIVSADLMSRISVAVVEVNYRSGPPSFPAGPPDELVRTGQPMGRWRWNRLNGTWVLDPRGTHDAFVYRGDMYAVEILVP